MRHMFIESTLTRYGHDTRSKIGVTLWADREGGGAGGLDPPWKITKNIGFICNSGQDPWKITKLPSQHPMTVHHRPASKTGLVVIDSSVPLVN